jgi:hypothetical protein
MEDSGMRILKDPVSAVFRTTASPQPWQCAIIFRINANSSDAQLEASPFREYKKAEEYVNRPRGPMARRLTTIVPIGIKRLQVRSLPWSEVHSFASFAADASAATAG